LANNCGDAEDANEPWSLFLSNNIISQKPYWSVLRELESHVLVLQAGVESSHSSRRSRRWCTTNRRGLVALGDGCLLGLLLLCLGLRQNTNHEYCSSPAFAAG